MKAYKGRIEGTTISVDNFRPSASVTHYFLTHGHSDHCTGITPTWNFSVIYTTSVTKKFIISKYHLPPNIIIELEIGRKRIIPLVGTRNDNNNNNNNLSFSVTPIDANHCPGAVCYLFVGYFGRFLCTGDFRYKKGLFDNYNVINVDRLYLDDTYCAPYYNKFLTYNEAANAIKNIIKLPINQNCKFMIAVDTLGKENILIQISILLKTLIIVNNDRYKRLKLLFETETGTGTGNSINISRYFTTNINDGYIFMVNKREISLKNLDRLNEKIFQRSQFTQLSQDNYHQFVGIMPSGWSIGKNPLTISTYGSRFYKIVYSAHSSYEELCAAVRYVEPKSIIPIVDDKHSRAPRCFKYYLSKLKPTYFKIPSVINDILNGKRNYSKIAVQHLSTNNVNNIITRKFAKRKQISSLLKNKQFKKKKFIKYKQIDKGKVLSENKKKEIIDLLSPLNEDDDDDNVASLSISHLMEDDNNFIGDNILTQPVDLILNNNLSVISTHSDPFSYINDDDDDDIISLFSPPKKRRKIMSVKSNNDGRDVHVGKKRKRKKRRKYADKLIDTTQFMDDIDDGYDIDIDIDIDNMDDDIIVNDNNEFSLSELKIMSAKRQTKKRKSKRNSLEDSNNNKENEDVHILDMNPSLTIYSAKKRKFNDIQNNYDFMENGIDFMATFSGTDGSVSDWDDNLLNNVCDQISQPFDDNNNKQYDIDDSNDNDSDSSIVITTQRSRKNNKKFSNDNIDVSDNKSSNNVVVIRDIIDLT